MSKEKLQQPAPFPSIEGRVGDGGNEGLGSIRQALHWANSVLQSTSPSPQRDAEILLGAILHKGRSYLFAYPEQVLSADRQQAFVRLIQQRVTGIPVAYLLGEREFWSLNLTVTPDTLIPRPETELLVEETLARIPNRQAVRVLDLGTGTGAIALSIAKERPFAQVLGIDSQSTCVQIASQNASRHQLSNVRFEVSDWFSTLGQEAAFDLIVSNPPYIPALDPHLSQGDVRFEPRHALSSGLDGLDAIRHIIGHAPVHLKPMGWLLLEHGYDQGDAVPELLRQAGFEQVVGVRDYADLARVSLGRIG